MITIHEMQKELWVELPNGNDGVVVMITQEPAGKTTWFVCDEKTRKIEQFYTHEIKLSWKNPMFEHLFKDEN